MRITLLTTFLLVSLTSLAQQRKFVFLEGGGSGVLGNVNFDMRFNKDQSNDLGFKAGIGYFFLDRRKLQLYL